MSPAGASLAARHDLEVLQGTARSLATGGLPGSGRAMAHSGRLCGQLHQALAEPAQAQLLCRPREEGGSVGQEGSAGAAHVPFMPSRTLTPIRTCSGLVPTVPRPPTSHTNIQVADMEGLLLR